MKKLMLTLLFSGLGIAATMAQDNNDYHYETRTERVWIPEQKAGGLLGIGRKTIPGHYENREVRVKVYKKQGDGDRNKHPHGMPPGQRKKMQNRRGTQINRPAGTHRDTEQGQQRSKRQGKGKQRN